MEREHVHTEYLTVVEDETSSFSLVFSAASGERVIVYSAGTNEHLRPATLDAAALAAADVVYLNHIQPDSCTIEDPIVDALHLNRAIRLTWNPGGCQIDAGLREAGNRRLLERTDILLLNKEEALAFAGVGDVDTALRTLLQTGTKIVCVTDGKRGAVATDGKTLYSCPIAPAPVVDTTGAGDAFGAGFTWGLATGHDLPTSLLAGTINGAGVVSQIGAQPGLLTDTQMHLALRSAPITVKATTL
jgi:sugar/nucleoside kinase (ribokinase family)